VTLPSLTAGTLFGARWIVGRVLGKNPLAVVYEAESASEARFAALKLFDSALSRDATAWSRFESLTRALATLPGDGIARSYEVGLNDGRPFVASERSTFPTLSRYVAERGQIAPRTFRDTLVTLAGALDAAHGAGITHGNLKPQNVFVSVDHSGWARLTDFGLADLREACGVHQARTLGWNAPEVSPAAPTPASDLFGLGLLSFFALSGTPWYSAQRSSASGVPLPRAASERARVFGGEILQVLDPWFDRALAQNPGERFANALEMAQAFASALDGRTSIAPSITVTSEDADEPLLPSEPPVPKLDPNAPTVPQLAVAMTEPMPARDPAARASVPAPTFSSPPPAKPPTKPPAPADVSTSPLGLALIVIAALVLGGLAIVTFVWVFVNG
jgi:serine/threonine-protein kinase